MWSAPRELLVRRSAPEAPARRAPRPGKRTQAVQALARRPPGNEARARVSSHVASVLVTARTRISGPTGRVARACAIPAWLFVASAVPAMSKQVHREKGREDEYPEPVCRNPCHGLPSFAARSAPNVQNPRALGRCKPDGGLFPPALMPARRKVSGGRRQSRL